MDRGKDLMSSEFRLKFSVTYTYHKEHKEEHDGDGSSLSHAWFFLLLGLVPPSLGVGSSLS